MAAPNDTGSGIAGVTDTGSAPVGTTADSTSSPVAAGTSAAARPSFDDLADGVAALRDRLTKAEAENADLGERLAKLEGSIGARDASASGTDTGDRLSRLETVLRAPFDREFAEFDAEERDRAAAAAKAAAV